MNRGSLVLGRGFGIASVVIGLVNAAATLLFCGALIFSSLFYFGVITSPDEFLAITENGAVKQRAEYYPENENDIEYVDAVLTLPGVTHVEKSVLPNKVKDFIDSFTEEWMFLGYLAVFGLSVAGVFLASVAKRKDYSTRVSKAGTILGVTELCLTVLCAVMYFVAMLVAT